MKKILSFALIAAMLLTLSVGCGKTTDTTSTDAGTKTTAENTTKQEPAKKDVTIKMYQLKVEIKDQLDKMAKDYEKETGVKFEIETAGGGVNYQAMLQTRFASGEEPDIFNCNGYADLDKLIDKCEDLTNEAWAKDLVAGVAEPMMKDGKLYGQPQCIEGYGFAYNKDLFAKAGVTGVPKTLAQLEDACKKLQAAGITPFSNGYKEFWVLGKHNINAALANQAEPRKFVEGLNAGTEKLKGNAIAEGWVKLFDLTKKYGQKNMITADYNTSVNDFATGKAAMIQQGNWIWGNIEKVNNKLNVGFLPMPVSDQEVEKVFVGMPQAWSINKNSKVKDEAKAWLNWLVTSDTGKKYITDEFQFIPAFTTIQSTKLNPLSASLSEYAKDSKTLGWFFDLLPSGTDVDIAAAMQAYLADKANGEQMLEQIEKAITAKAKK